jgi:uncharacterized protein (TIGR00251 family)
MDPIGRAKDGCPILRVYVQPRATRSRCCGLHAKALKLAVTAPPVDGKANKAALRFVAELFGVGRRDIALVSGMQSRDKTIHFSNLTEKELRERLARVLSQTPESKDK